VLPSGNHGQFIDNRAPFETGRRTGRCVLGKQFIKRKPFADAVQKNLVKKVQNLIWPFSVRVPPIRLLIFLKFGTLDQKGYAVDSNLWENWTRKILLQEIWSWLFCGKNGIPLPNGDYLNREDRTGEMAQAYLLRKISTYLMDYHLSLQIHFQHAR